MFSQLVIFNACRSLAQSFNLYAAPETICEFVHVWMPCSRKPNRIKQTLWCWKQHKCTLSNHLFYLSLLIVLCYAFTIPMYNCPCRDGAAFSLLYIYAYCIHIHVHTFTHACMHAYIHTYIQTYIPCALCRRGCLCALVFEVKLGVERMGVLGTWVLRTAAQQRRSAPRMYNCVMQMYHKHQRS